MYMAFFYSQPHSLVCLPLPDVEDDDMEALTASAPSLRLLDSYQDMIEERLDTVKGEADKIQKLQAYLSENSTLISSVKGAYIERKDFAQKLREAWQLYRLLQEHFGTYISDDTMFAEYLSGKLPKRAERISSNLRYAFLLLFGELSSILFYSQAVQRSKVPGLSRDASERRATWVTSKIQTQKERARRIVPDRRETSRSKYVREWQCDRRQAEDRRRQSLHVVRERTRR
jgi:hypothetical protein